MREVPGMTAQDTLLSVTTLSFDIFGFGNLAAAYLGAKVVIASEEATRDGKELASPDAAERSDGYASHSVHVAVTCWRTDGKAVLI